MQHKLLRHTDLPQRLRLPPGGVFISGMGFPAQGQKGQEVGFEARSCIFVSVDLLAFVRDHGTRGFARNGERAPSAVCPSHDDNYSIQAFLLRSVTLKSLHPVR